ncbi:MAG: hypothetical protein JNN00_12925 [Chitinophagaceae bacterium]|nr:hypothetical protein [Chitinophagaceae bacterium]
MKIDVTPSLVQMDAEELRNLTAEVRETVATGIQLPKARKKVFTAADMWNISRNAKSASAMLKR